jgi:hypothetical protein
LIRTYSSQFTCLGVNWSAIELNFISFHSNPCGLRWIHARPNKALGKKKLDQLRKKNLSAAAKRLCGYDLSITFINSETGEIYLSIMLNTVSKSIGLGSDLILVLILVHSNIEFEF